MKANVPEMIWINPTTDLPKLSGVMDKNSVEYVHNNAFVDKACDYLRNHIDKDLTIYHEQTWCKRDEFIENFKTYMRYG